VRDTLARYTDVLFRLATGSLVKPKIGQSIDDLRDRVCDAQSNAPVIDRRLRELPAGAQALVRLMGLSRCPVWKAGHLIALAAAAGHADGFAPVEELLGAGVAFPADGGDSKIADFAAWFGQAGTLAAPVFVHPAVLARARGLVSAPPAKARGTVVGASDGLEWPLRIAAAWQRSRAAAVKTTLAKTLFKRDLARLQSDELLTSPFAESAVAVPDAGVLAFEWAVAAGLFRAGANEFVAEPAIPDWSDSPWPTLAHLFARFFAVETWDPRAGYAPSEGGLNPTPTAALAILDQLARANAPRTAAELAGPLWEHHPSWPSALSRDDARDHGAAWVEAFLQAIAGPLRLVEAVAGEPRAYRLAEFGRYLLCGDPEPPAPPAFPQTLTVQPNAEMIVYRQGLTPRLIAELSRFAAWKRLGTACTLELTADETYRGLESGLTLAVMRQTLDRHAMRPLPANVADLLRRWADKRERVTVYPSATLVEFLSPADLDLALSRGTVAIKLTDRIGLTADGHDPDFRLLRLIGNREYDARPAKCVSIAPDGLTLTVDAGQADLLLEAEIGRLAEPLPLNGTAHRQFRLTPASLRAANSKGMNLESIDRWLGTRAGEPLSAAGRLFLTFDPAPRPQARTCRVVRLPSPEFADGLLQWPDTAELVRERLGPTAIVVDDDRLPELKAKLNGLGIELEEGLQESGTR